MSVGTGRPNIIILFWKYLSHFWEYINANQTFILDSDRPFNCSAPNSELIDYNVSKKFLMSCSGRSEKVVELESSTSKVAELQIGQNLFLLKLSLLKSSLIRTKH